MPLMKVVALLTAVIGLAGTFVHKVPGTLLILAAAIGYSVTSGTVLSSLFWFGVLFLLMVLAEFGGKLVRRRLLPQADIDKAFGLDVAAGSFASLILTDVLAGPVLGLLIWELLIGKSLMPLIKRSSTLVVGLFAAAMFRFTMAFMMLVILVFKIL